MSTNSLSCRYKSCNKPALEGSLFCEDHGHLGSGVDFPKWLKKICTDLPVAIVGGIVVEILKTLILGLPGLSAANLEQLDTLAARLDEEVTARDEVSARRTLEGVGKFFQENRDLQFCDVVNYVLQNSAKYAQVAEDNERFA